MINNLNFFGFFRKAEAGHEWGQSCQSVQWIVLLNFLREPGFARFYVAIFAEIELEPTVYEMELPEATAARRGGVVALVLYFGYYLTFARDAERMQRRLAERVTSDSP